jgi:malonyl-CoA/methylmalonyl-CoA synthetase
MLGTMTLPELFAPTFRGRASQVALEWACQEFTFGDLDRRADRMAAALTTRGLGAGDRLAIYLPNRIEYVYLFLACTRLGVIVVPVNVLYRERELRHILTDASPRALVLADPEWDRGSVSSWTGEVWMIDDLAHQVPDGHARGSSAALSGDTPAAIVYTSGTTGAAKGAVITHGNLAANARTLVGAWRIISSDRFLLTLPLFHVHGLGNGLHCWLLSGCRTRLLERFDHQSAAATMLDFRPTLFFGVPTMYVRLLEVDAAVAREIGARLRLCVSGSAPLPAHVLDAFESLYGVRILERYGMTETLMTVSNPYEGERRAGTVGLPLPGVDARIVDGAGRDVPEDVGGELIVRAPTLFAGYWNRPDASSQAFDEGWFKTGDIARRSADGYITLCGRRSDLIIAGGFNVYPREIEDVLAEHPSVAEVAVAGAPDSRRGEVPVAYVVRKDGSEIDEPALIAWCKEQLASFKVPRRVQFLERLPRTALGKVQKNLLSAAGHGNTEDTETTRRS